MFKRLYSFGGVAYVVGGGAVLAMCLMPIAFVLYGLGLPIPDGILKASAFASLAGIAIVSVVFNSGSMQVVAQNHTTEALERISRQLAEQAEEEKLNRRNVRRPHQRKQVHEEPVAAQTRESVEASAVEDVPREGYFCPITKTFIPVR